eukprot:g45776.t1
MGTIARKYNARQVVQEYPKAIPVANWYSVLSSGHGDNASGNCSQSKTYSTAVEDTNNMLIIDDKEAMAGEDLEMIIITKEVVLIKLLALKIDPSPGPDGMSPRVLKDDGDVANVLVVQQVNGMLFSIARGMEFKSREVMLQLYRVL